jgi:hypothetical protein
MTKENLSEAHSDESLVFEQEPERQYEAALAGNGHAISCAYDIENLSVRRLTVEVADVQSDIYVMPTEEPNTYVAWIHYPGENTMSRMFTVQHHNDWDVACTVIERYLLDLLNVMSQDSEEVAN